MIKRYYDNLGDYVKPNKVLILYGPRQIGKTTLLKNYLSSDDCKYKYKYVTGDSLEASQTLSSRNLRAISDFIGKNGLIVLDEAQQIEDVGIGLKLIVDNFPNVAVIATGSSSLELANKIGEPLVGRANILNLYPLSILELAKENTNYELNQQLDSYLRFGLYPEVLSIPAEADKQSHLKKLIDMYLLKDVLSFEGIKGSSFVIKLLKLLAIEVGSTVSLNKLANDLDVNLRTVEKYINLLEKTFIIHSLGGFSTNLRNEINTKNKYYFYDLGIRNAIIGNFSEPEFRSDKGALWENLLFMERLKKQEYKKIYANNYFWRTWDQKEIDLIEERGGNLYGYEFKYKSDKEGKAPKLFSDTYKNSFYELINKENYLDFVT